MGVPIVPLPPLSAAPAGPAGGVPVFPLAEAPAVAAPEAAAAAGVAEGAGISAGVVVGGTVAVVAVAAGVWALGEYAGWWNLDGQKGLLGNKGKIDLKGLGLTSFISGDGGASHAVAHAVNDVVHATTVGVKSVAHDISHFFGH